MVHISQVQTDDGLSWHVEQTGSGPHLLLIPSGEGDCHCFTKLALLLASDFTVTTFDMPCFSRTVGPHSAVENLSPYKIADQIISLMDKLSIQSASVYGSSSGSVIAIAMMSKYNSRVDKAIVYEVPLRVIPGLMDLAKSPESENPKIVEHFKGIFANGMNEDLTAWEGLGEEYHKRLEKNYVTWVRNYAPVVNKMVWDKEELKAMRERIYWSVGRLMPMFWFFDNVVLATEVGIKTELLNSKHFPQRIIAVPNNSKSLTITQALGFLPSSAYDQRSKMAGYESVCGSWVSLEEQDRLCEVSLDSSTVSSCRVEIRREGGVPSNPTIILENIPFVILTPDTNTPSQSAPRPYKKRPTRHFIREFKQNNEDLFTETLWQI
ncbi:alpha/beta-hydrolase [Acephala macrosclerotiorum]|nr:alpha/beta-hydrolase [Acephala macrosclerotiorum]